MRRFVRQGGELYQECGYVTLMSRDHMPDKVRRIGSDGSYALLFYK